MIIAEVSTFWVEGSAPGGGRSHIRRGWAVITLPSGEPSGPDTCRHRLQQHPRRAGDNACRDERLHLGPTSTRPRCGSRLIAVSPATNDRTSWLGRAAASRAGAPVEVRSLNQAVCAALPQTVAGGSDGVTVKQPAGSATFT